MSDEPKKNASMTLEQLTARVRTLGAKNTQSVEANVLPSALGLVCRDITDAGIPADCDDRVIHLRLLKHAVSHPERYVETDWVALSDLSAVERLEFVHSGTVFRPRRRRVKK